MVYCVIFGAVQSHASRKVARLYQSHGAIVFRRARQILGSEEAAEDVLQEIFRGILERPETIARAKNEVAWLYGATTHLCLNRIRN
ncbi:MAG: sigma factor, partial [Polyangiales bacterium]